MDKEERKKVIARINQMLDTANDPIIKAVEVLLESAEKARNGNE